MTTRHTDPTLRHDIVLAFEAINSNPNGDPDQGNRPRMDEETGHGLVTDVAIKRKIRDTLPLVAQDAGQDHGYDILIAPEGFLSDRLEGAYGDQGVPPEPVKGKKVTDTQRAQTATAHTDARARMLAGYADVRLFGAVMSTGRTRGLGKVRGPVQVTFARSIDPIDPIQVGIGRVVQSTRGEDDNAAGHGTFGDKWIVPYGLYVATISFSPGQAAKTGVTTTDLDLLYRCLQLMFEQTASASRPNMATRALHVFTHTSPLGNAPAHTLHDRIRWTHTTDTPARHYSDYREHVNLEGLPNGITHTRLL